VVLGGEGWESVGRGYPYSLGRRVVRSIVVGRGIRVVVGECEIG